ncbi:MAG: SAM-dependent chlorinase/fluorinase [Candidatus Rokubacteria bacterium]|nr:SAM-dependent chlorinase/fluorinase [Candidatus Rokubacteria bacterium]
MRRQAPIVTLTTDFGLRDPYVAEMKAAILSIARDVQFIDITHEIAAHGIVEAALALESAVPYFPDGTIHLAVVDPGVGTARRGLVVEAGGQRFVGPDNGIFSAFVTGGPWRAWELTAKIYRRHIVSSTFHGRDVFGPAAAHLARGVRPARFGPLVVDPVTLPLMGVRRGRGAVEGVVVHVDRFGNLVTSIRADDFVDDGTIEVRIAGGRLPLVGTYGDLRPGRAGALLGSNGRLEIVVREGSAAERLRARRGARVVVWRRRARGGRPSRT